MSQCQEDRWLRSKMVSIVIIGDTFLSYLVSAPEIFFFFDDLTQSSPKQNFCGFSDIFVRAKWNKEL